MPITYREISAQHAIEMGHFMGNKLERRATL